eukprot:XP_011452816.1 PREDICTED: uncharacterized protein LOC105346062 [Crassostrea gigas]
MMFYLVLLAVTASVHSVMYGPGAPVPVGPRLDGVSTNPFAGYMTLPIKRQGCQPASKYNVDAIFDRSFLCPRNTQMPQNWPTTVQNRFFIPDQQFQDYQKQNLLGCFTNPQNDPRAIEYYKQTYDALETWKYSGLDMEFSQCFSDLYKYEDAVQITKYKLDPVCKTHRVDLSGEAIWHNFNGIKHKCFIPFPQQLTTVKCTHSQKDDIDNCRMGYDIRSEYRCAPTNFVRRKVNLVCPEIQRVFIRSFDVPTACSCKLCYECKDVIPDPRVYINLPPAKK